MDAPEAEKSRPERIADQAAYFGITIEESMELGKAAKSFVLELLEEKEFTIWTRCRGARGRSALPRYYAIVMIGDEDLNQLLVSKGLARIYGTRTPLPDGRNSREYLQKLSELQFAAKKKHLGGWAAKL